jgi:hypothetical protein
MSIITILNVGLNIFYCQIQCIYSRINLYEVLHLLPPLVRDVTNYPVRNRNDYTVPRCRLSLYQSSFIPSVINLWNSLDNDTRNTRTSDSFKINLKSKVVLAKIPAHFLVGDKRHNILYARLRRSCSSLKYDLFQYHTNIGLTESMTDNKCIIIYGIAKR